MGWSSETWLLKSRARCADTKGSGHEAVVQYIFRSVCVGRGEVRTCPVSAGNAHPTSVGELGLPQLEKVGAAGLQPVRVLLAGVLLVLEV